MKKVLIGIGVVLVAGVIAFVAWRIFANARPGAVVGIQTSFDAIKDSGLDPNTGAHILYESFQSPPSSVMTGIGGFLKGELSENEARTILNNTDFSVLESIAQRPNLVPVIDWERAWMSDSRWTLKAKDGATLFAARAKLAALDGDSVVCARNIEQAVVLSNHLSQFGSGISYLMRPRALSAISHATSTACESFAQDADAIETVFRALGGLKECPELSAVQFEIPLAFTCIDSLAKGEVTIEEVSSGVEIPASERSQFEQAAMSRYQDLLKQTFERDLRSLTEHWGDYDALKADNAAFNADLGQVSDLGQLTANTVSRILMPNTDGLFRAEATDLTFTRAIKIGTAASLIRTESGGWPTIEQAAKRADVSTADPFGGTLRYVITGSVKIYSIGPNGVDDGGVRQQGSGLSADIVAFGR